MLMSFLLEELHQTPEAINNVDTEMCKKLQKKVSAQSTFITKTFHSSVATDKKPYK